MSHFPELSPLFGELLERLQGKRVCVIGHVRPDGDCIGSQVALTRLLIDQGVNTVAVNQHPVPSNMAAFAEGTPFFTADAADLTDRIALAVDCASRERIGDNLNDTIETFAGNLDHHVTNTQYANVNIVDAEATATAELIAGLALDNQFVLDAKTAQALYLGIVADTGQFRYATSQPRLFEICARLVEAGAHPGETARLLFQEEPLSKIELMRRFLGSLRLELDGRVCIGTLYRRDFEACHASREDAEGLVDYARDIVGVDIGAILEEMENGLTKGSLRATSASYRVDRVASAFGGGGHARAAGFTFSDPIEQFYPAFLEHLETHLQDVAPNAKH